MIKIAVCDVQKSGRAKIREYCERYFKASPLEYELQEFTSGESFLEIDFPDILFIDVKLGLMSGILVKEVLELKHADTRILFVSQTRENINKAFGRNVYGFLLKPLSYQAFEYAVKKVVSDLVEERSCVFCKKGNAYEKIYLREIIYLKSYGRYTKVYIRGHKEYRLSDKCMGDWSIETRDFNFASCHRCYVVNLAYVKAIDEQVKLLDGTYLPLAKSEKVRFKEIFEKAAWRNSYGKYDEKIL